MAQISTIVEVPPYAALPRRRRLRWVLGCVALTVAAGIGWEALDVFAGLNLHVVVPGRIYRGAQPDAADLTMLARRYGVRTIVNLRGTCNPQAWYLSEAKAAQDLGLALEDVTCSAGRWPSHTELRQLAAIFDHAEYPLFLHCRHGADRTGMAAAIALLLGGDGSYAEARRQLALRFGHVPFGRTTILDRFFDLYEAWLAHEGREHDRAVFRHWLLNVYRGGQCQSVIEQVTPLQPTWRVGDPLGFRVRVHNVSGAPWRFQPTLTAGMHLGCQIWNEAGQGIAVARGGMFDRTVEPGASLEITLVAPPMRRAGRYRLLIDMIEEGHCWFFQTGSEPWEEEIDVRN